MKATQKLHELGQSIWLDNITRDLLTTGALRRYIDELFVTGLTSNPTIFDLAIRNGDAYDAAIRDQVSGRGHSAESLFFDLAIDDITRAADLFRPIYERTNGADGFVSLEVSPLLARDAKGTLAQARELADRVARPNLLIKIPGTFECLPAVEEAIFSGIPVNVTLLFSREQYMAAAEAYLRGIERRMRSGLAPVVPSVASLFVSRWDTAVRSMVPARLSNRLGIAIAQRTYQAYCNLTASSRYERIVSSGGRPQRLLLASTGTKDPKASDILYVKALAAPRTVNTMPEATLHAFADHGEVGTPMSASGGECEAVIAEFSQAGIDVDALAARLQDDGAQAFVTSWNELIGVIASKAATLEKAG